MKFLTGRSLTGARIETTTCRRTARCSRVAPSRERGSKQFAEYETAQIERRSLTGARIETFETAGSRVLQGSLPHGSADRNASLKKAFEKTVVAPSRERGSKLGASVGRVSDQQVAPSRERGSKREKRRFQLGAGDVAPSRERGSKQDDLEGMGYAFGSLPHGSADRNKQVTQSTEPDPKSLPHGSADRNEFEMSVCAFPMVAPSRERGSKRARGQRRPDTSWSLPHGSADRNRGQNGRAGRNRGRSLTGARIETSSPDPPRMPDRVAPSRERGSKRRPAASAAPGRASLPHGSADRNGRSGPASGPDFRRSLTGARIETAAAPRRSPGRPVAPSRERGSKRKGASSVRTVAGVAPSRERGSKRRGRVAGERCPASLPHGSADRNAGVSA